MHGVVSLLDQTYTERVEQIWRRLDHEFGVRGVSVTPFPHFSYHIAADYNVELLEATLKRVAGETSPFRVKTTGLGIFTGAQPVLFVPVIRTAALSEFHQRLRREICDASSGSVGYYHPDEWVPHITLAHGDLDADTLGPIVGMLSEQAFTWEIPIDNLTLIYDTGTRQELRFRVSLGSGSLSPVS